MTLRALRKAATFLPNAIDEHVGMQMVTQPEVMPAIEEQQAIADTEVTVSHGESAAGGQAPEDASDGDDEVIIKLR